MQLSCLYTSYCSHYLLVPGKDDALSGSEEDKLLLTTSDTPIALPSIDREDNLSPSCELKPCGGTNEQLNNLMAQRFKVSEPCIALLANCLEVY